MGSAGRSFSDQQRKPEVLVSGKGIDFARDRQPDPFPGAPLSAAIIALEISRRNSRVAALQERWDRLRAGLDLILDQRGADMGDLPGGASRSLMRDYKGKEAGRLVTRIDPGVVSLVAELRGHERQAAEELGQWKIVEEPKPADVPTPVWWREFSKGWSSCRSAWSRSQWNCLTLGAGAVGQNWSSGMAARAVLLTGEYIEKGGPIRPQRVLQLVRRPRYIPPCAIHYPFDQFLVAARLSD